MLSVGFALGLLFGRVLVSPVLIYVPATAVLLLASVAMAVTTYFMLRTRKPGVALTLVALTGISMAPVFPTTLAVVGDMFPAVTGTAMGLAITCGWTGLAVSSRMIGAIAGNDVLRLRKALLVLPASAVLMGDRANLVDGILQPFRHCPAQSNTMRLKWAANRVIRGTINVGEAQAKARYSRPAASGVGCSDVTGRTKGLA